MNEAIHKETSSITFSRFKDSVAWHIHLTGDDFDEDAVLARIDAIHRKLAARYAPQDLEALLARSLPPTDES